MGSAVRDATSDAADQEVGDVAADAADQATGDAAAQAAGDATGDAADQAADDTTAQAAGDATGDAADQAAGDAVDDARAGLDNAYDQPECIRQANPHIPHNGGHDCNDQNAGESVRMRRPPGRPRKQVSFNFSRARRGSADTSSDTHEQDIDEGVTEARTLRMSSRRKKGSQVYDASTGKYVDPTR